MTYLHAEAAAPAQSNEIPPSEYLAGLQRRWLLLAATPLVAGALGFAASFLVTPTFTARTLFLPPAQQQSAAAGALASLGALAGVTTGGRNMGDQYVTFLQSRTVTSALVDRFDLMKVYDVDLRYEALRDLAARTRVSLGKKDGIIMLEVDDHDPQRAADLGNAYVEELRRLTAGLTLTEAQQRRIFFEGQLKQIRGKLEEAQNALQSSGVSAATIKSEPKAAVEAVAKLRAEITSAEVRLQMLRSSLADNTPEVRQQNAAIDRLRGELARAGQAEQSTSGGYVGAYREFKYQETLFDLIARQYELARIDESRDGGQLQVIDKAVPPERKSKPRRSFFAAGAAVAALAIVVGWCLIQVRRNRPS
jgi:uncharacterized protein involved in exopolysaccharide biosynthesis